MSKLEIGRHGTVESKVSALIASKAGVSGIVDLLGNGRGKVQMIDGNSNLISPRPILPIVIGSAPPGTTWVAVRVFAFPSRGDGSTGSEDGSWVEEWGKCERGVGGLRGLREEYPFLGE